MFRPAVVSHKSFADPRGSFPAMAADFVGVVLILVGVVMSLSMILLPLGIVLVSIGVLSLMRGLNEPGEKTPLVAHKEPRSGSGKV